MSPGWVPGPSRDASEALSKAKEQQAKKILETCWKCGQWGKVKDESLGLCPRCIEVLRDDDYVAPFFWATPADGPAERDTQDRTPPL